MGDRRGQVYFIQGHGGNIKIGYTAGDVKDRISHLQTGSSERLLLLGTLPGDARLEVELHKVFKKSQRVGEWFGGEILIDVHKLLARSSSGRDTRIVVCKKAKDILEAPGNKENFWLTMGGGDGRCPKRILLQGLVGVDGWSMEEVARVLFWSIEHNQALLCGYEAFRIRDGANLHHEEWSTGVSFAVDFVVTNVDYIGMIEAKEELFARCIEPLNALVSGKPVAVSFWVEAQNLSATGVLSDHPVYYISKRVQSWQENTWRASSPIVLKEPEVIEQPMRGGGEKVLGFTLSQRKRKGNLLVRDQVDRG